MLGVIGPEGPSAVLGRPKRATGPKRSAITWDYQSAPWDKRAPLQWSAGHFTCYSMLALKCGIWLAFVCSFAVCWFNVLDNRVMVRLSAPKRQDMRVKLSREIAAASAVPQSNNTNGLRQGIHFRYPLLGFTFISRLPEQCVYANYSCLKGYES